LTETETRKTKQKSVHLFVVEILRVAAAAAKRRKKSSSKNYKQNKLKKKTNNPIQIKSFGETFRVRRNTFVEVCRPSVERTRNRETFLKISVVGFFLPFLERKTAKFFLAPRFPLTISECRN